jgi:hypothetical protein
VADIATVAVSGAVGFLAATGKDFILDAVRWHRKREGRREEREEQAAREQAREDRELRQAVRLIVEELLYARGVVKAALRRETYWDPSDRQLPASVWEQKRAVVAAQAGSSDSWRLAADAYSRLDELNWEARQAKEADDEERGRLLQDVDEPSEAEALLSELEPQRVDERVLRDGLEVIDAAIEGLERLVGDRK